METDRTELMQEIFSRTALIAGGQMMKELAATRVIIFGLGGVGSWCAESLVRSGVGTLTLVDFDTVALSNINRQLPATLPAVGMEKTEVMRRRLLEINPQATIEIVHGAYTAETAASFRISGYDYAIDAIDSLADKADLILHCTDPATAPRRAFFSSMGAALKLHASMISTAEFFKVTGCPLARALRNYFKRHNRFPRRKFRCVYSPERLANRLPAEDGTPVDRSRPGKTVNGTFAHTTAIFGFTLAGLVIEDIYSRN